MVLINKWNVLTYADDIFHIDPSLKGLQKFIDILKESIQNIELMINVNKFKYIVLKIYMLESSVKLYDEIIERVSQSIMPLLKKIKFHNGKVPATHWPDVLKISVVRMRSKLPIAPFLKVTILERKINQSYGYK